jgi:hypothetical protein
VPRPRTPLLALLVAAPPLLVAALGLAHPVFLTADTAERWRAAHLVLLAGFPLVAVALWVVLRGVPGIPAWGARILAGTYAVLYGGLDAIAGVGAPHQVLRAAERGDPRPPVEDLYDIGDRLGQLGVLALAVAIVLAALALRGAYAVAGAVVGLVASWLLLRHHVFPPLGVLSMVGLAVSFALLQLSRSRVT